jgi:hypothetical protein
MAHGTPSYAAFTDVTSTVIPGLTGFREARAAWGDYNNDGFVDLNIEGTLYRNNSGANFTVVDNVGDNGLWGDYDNDGFLDSLDYSGGILYRNNSGTNFSTVAIQGQGPRKARGASWGDHDNDGFIDLHIGGYEIWGVENFHDIRVTNNQGTGLTTNWVQPIDGSNATNRPRPARGIASADFDRDGDIDIYVSNYRVEPNALYVNDGTGNFIDEAAVRGALGGTANDQWSNTISSAWGDIDNDGELDIFVGNFAHSAGHSGPEIQPQSRFLRNRGSSNPNPADNYTFEDMGQGGVGWQESYASPTLGDYDNDGDLDLFFTTVYESDAPRMYRNDGNFNFTDVTSSLGLSGIGQTYRAAFADYDNDGDLDLTTGGSLFENQGNSNHWIKLKMVGDGQSVNRDAIGAQVRIQANGKTHTRQVEAGTGEGNQNDPTLHFGLGSHSGTVDLDILWPGGTTSQVTGLAVDQLHSIDTIAISTQARVPLTPSSVIGGSASLNDGGFLWDSTDAEQGEGFNGTNITDRDKSEDGIDSMWLVNAGGIDPAYLVIDLGDTYDIDEITLFNAHNRNANNFGTDDFRIDASNAVVDTGGPADFDLSGTVETILTGNLSDTSGEDPISTADSFTSITPHSEGSVRYLKFVALSGIYGNNDLRGLNEIEVFIDTDATDFTWITSNIGDWADNDNWSFESGLSALGARVNSPDRTAIFGDDISGPTTVSTHAAVSVNRVVFDNDTNSYAIAGFGSVNLASTTDPSPVTPSISVTGTHEFQVDVNLQNDTTIDVAGGSTLIFDNSLDLMGNTLTKTGAGTMNINNNLSTGGGTVIITAGVLGGSGEVGGDVDNQGGAISPGNSPGVMEIDGQYSQGADASLLIELAGTDAGLSDLLSVGGIASLSGQLAVTLLDGFQPALGDDFDVLDFGAIEGEFNEILLPSLSDGLAWDVSSLYSNGSLSIIPEPASWVLLGVMIALGVAANRRRV